MSMSLEDPLENPDTPWMPHGRTRSPSRHAPSQSSSSASNSSRSSRSATRGSIVSPPPYSSLPQCGALLRPPFKTSSGQLAQPQLNSDRAESDSISPDIPSSSNTSPMSDAMTPPPCEAILRRSLDGKRKCGSPVLHQRWSHSIPLPPDMLPLASASHGRPQSDRIKPDTDDDSQHVPPCPVCMQTMRDVAPDVHACRCRFKNVPSPDLKGKGKAPPSESMEDNDLAKSALDDSLAKELERDIVDEDLAFARQIIEEDEILIEEEKSRRQEEEERMFRDFFNREQEEARVHAMQMNVAGSHNDGLPTCDLCQATLSFDVLQSPGGSGPIHYLENCTHAFCKSCIVQYVVERAKGTHASVSGVVCPKCGDKPIAPIDLQAFLPKVDYDRLLNNEMEQLVTRDANFVKCPQCHVIIERESLGGFDLAVQDPKKFIIDGIRCTPEAYKHHEEQRFRCRQCACQFCAECHESPYHLGKTCADFKKFRAGLKCRFCEAPIESPAEPSKPEPPQGGGILSFFTGSKQQPSVEVLVCKDEECVKRAAEVCPKILSCGHKCCGIKVTP